MSVIEVEDLVKRYGPKVAVDGVSFAVERGEIFGILGPNGAGKTTTVESIAGLRRPDGGSIRVLGLDPQADRRELRRRVGVQLQESRLPDRITVGEAVRLYASFYRDPADTCELIDRLDLSDQRRTRFSRLSGGQQQRVSIALALVGRPEIAILDELTTGLDPRARRSTWALVEDVRASGVTVLLVTHSMEEAERLADRLVVIDQGRVLAIDTPAGLVARAGKEHRLRFRPSAPIHDRLLTDLAEVTRVERRGSTVEVTGTGDVVQLVTAMLARRQIIAEDLRVEQVTLDDAFVALTEKETR